MNRKWALTLFFDPFFSYSGGFEFHPVALYNPGRVTRLFADCMNVVYKELASEHKELMSLIAEVEAFRSAAGIQTFLERLHELLIRHFSHEQFPDGLYDRMGAYGSDLHPQLQVLIEDHCVILSGIRALSERAGRAGAEDDSTFVSDLAEIIAHLRRHEQREHELAERLMALDARADEHE